MSTCPRFTLLLAVLLTTATYADQFDEAMQKVRTAREQGSVEETIAALDAARKAVIATPAGATTPVTSKPAEKKPEVDLLSRLSERGFWLQLSPGRPSPASSPAAFSVSRDIEGGGDTLFNAAFTLSYSPAAQTEEVLNEETGEITLVPPPRKLFFGLKNTAWKWATSLQGQLTSADNKAANAWAFRVGADINHNNPRVSANARQRQRGKPPGGTPFYTFSWWDVKAKFEADQDLDNQRVSFEVDVAPILNLPGLGAVTPNWIESPNAFMRFAWQPYIGFDVGSQIASDGTSDPFDDPLRLIGRVEAAVYLDFLQRALGLNSVTLSGKDQINYLTDSSEAYNYASAILNFKLNETVGLGVSYVNGKQPPNFERTESWNAAFTVQF